LEGKQLNRKTMDMNFGKWIVVAFIVFTVFIATLATICIRQDVPLVSKDYYQEELAYQEQIGRIENANLLAETPVIAFDKNNITITYKNLASIKNGKLKLIRPSDENLDQNFELQSVEGNVEQFEIKNPVPGMYRAKMSWEQEGKQYFIERIIVL
jgi:hypothetical protein